MLHKCNNRSFTLYKCFLHSDGNQGGGKLGFVVSQVLTYLLVSWLTWLDLTGPVAESRFREMAMAMWMLPWSLLEANPRDWTEWVHTWLWITWSTSNCVLLWTTWWVIVFCSKRWRSWRWVFSAPFLQPGWWHCVWQLPLEIDMTEVNFLAKNNNTKFINFFFFPKECPHITWR